MLNKEFKMILENHRHWINEDIEGWENMRADLNLLDLHCIDFSGADLSGAKLYGANLSEANLYGADLSEANLSGANLYGANLYGADLSGAKLYGANLYGADLSEANLSGANLYGADLSEANLSGAKNAPAIPYSCPDTGSFIGWKKASGKIVCLEIPEDAKRLSAAGRKCRCNKAKVLNITEYNGDPCDLTEVSSNFDLSFVYRVGETVTVYDFDEDRWNECSRGIHFFINRVEAVNY